MDIHSLQPKITFLYSLPQYIEYSMRIKGFDYNLFLGKIREIDGVNVQKLSKEYFSTTHNSKILIILGEFLEKENALLLESGTLLKLADLTDLICASFKDVEIIDCAFCLSKTFHDDLKKRTKALVNTNNDSTQVEARLELYSLLLKRDDLGKKNYKESYDIVIDRLEAKQKKREPQELANLPEGTKLGTKETVTMPYIMEREKKYPFTVYIHNDDNKCVEDHIKWENAGAHIRWNIPISDLIVNEKYVVSLSFDPATNLTGAGEQKFLWKEETIILTFVVEISKEFKGDSIWSYITIKRNNENEYNYRCVRRIIVVQEKDLPEIILNQSDKISRPIEFPTLHGYEVNYKEIWRYYRDNKKIADDISLDDFVYYISRARLSKLWGDSNHRELLYLIRHLRGKMEHLDCFEELFKGGNGNLAEVTLRGKSTTINQGATIPKCNRYECFSVEWENEVIKDLGIYRKRITNNNPSSFFRKGFLAIPLVKMKEIER